MHNKDNKQQHFPTQQRLSLPIFDMTSLSDIDLNNYDPASLSSPVVPADPMKWTLPDLLQANGEGLADVPSAVLERCISPVLEGLKSIDAESLLELDRATSESEGVIVSHGRYCKPIHQQIQPPCSDDTVRYLHLSDQPGQYSMGIFVFPPHSTIPLHDHPGMCVLSRVLYGSLQRVSLDLAREEEEETEHMEESEAMQVDSKEQPHEEQENRKSFLSSPWRMSWRSNSSSSDKKADSVPPLPEGSRRAFKNGVDHLEAPACAVLYPFEGNLHQFEAGPEGAAILDVLFPPYDDQDRDCTFYNIRPDERAKQSAQQNPSHKESCIVVPTGQPESFHCISGQYRTLGAAN